jgi:hypothetical protein
MEMFVDPAMEYSAVAPAGFLSCPLVLFEYDDAERAVPVPTPQLPGDGAPYDPCAHDADIICFHLVRSIGWRNRWSER